jgi:glycosyltransferase involved in cell wall biosynthesis
MKILMIVFNMVDRGTYFRANAFARDLVRFGHTVTLMATSQTSRLRAHTRIVEGVTLIETPDLFSGPLRSGWDPFNALARIDLIKNQDFDIVYAFESRPVVLVPALWLWKKGVPLVMDWCDWFGKGGSVEERPNALLRTMLRPVETYFEEHFRQRACATTVICTTLQKRAISLGVKPETIAVIPNGFDTPDWKQFTREEARKTLGIKNEDYLVGYVGSLFQRDARLMAEAFDLVAGRLNNCRLVHIGTSSYSPRSWMTRPETLIETGRIDQDGLSLYLAACDVCWLPFKDTNANRGRFPMKLTNYIAAGKPIIATKVGDVSEIVMDSGVGSVIKDDAKVLADATCVILGDTNLRMKMGEMAIRLAKNPHHAWKARTRQLESILLRCVMGPDK